MTATKEIKAFYEEEILLEEWMTDLEFWARSMDSSAVDEFKSSKVKTPEAEEEIIEQDLEIEEWMLNFNWINKELFEEEELKFENWMVYPKNWNIYSCG